MTTVISGGTVQALMTDRPAGSSRDVVDPGIPLVLYDGAMAGQNRIAPLDVWGTQPSVRKVVDFIARAVASTPLKVYRRKADNDRERITDHPMARVLRSPSVGVTPYRFWHAIIADWMIFDRWVILKAATDSAEKPIDLVRIQAHRVRFQSDGLGRVRKVLVDGKKLELDPAGCILDSGYAPLGANGTSPIATLGDILAESREAVNYRRAVWKRQGRVPTVIERPADAPDWSIAAQNRFAASWSQYTSGGGNEGGTPILQDGMKLTKVDAFSPKDTNDIQGRQLTDVEVSSSYHIAPELVGAREGTYSNVEAFRQMLYRDGLGPVFIAWEQALNSMLAPDLDPTGELYIEADIDSKLRGSFEEQAKVATMLVGGPTMTRNEYRGRINLPAIDGGDELIVPLNVIEGGQANPTDSAPPPKGARVIIRRKDGTAKVKATASEAHEKRTVEVLRKFFARQRKAVLSAIGAKAAGDTPAWWDQARWNEELAADLFKLALSLTTELAGDVLAKLGLPDEYDPDRTVEFLKAVTEYRAELINDVTLQQLQDVQDSEDEDSDETPADVFDKAEDSRAKQGGRTLATTLAAFAGAEAVEQVEPKATKTWRTNSGNPRPSHARMDGETVPVGERFSNRAKWPGDFVLGFDGVAGCECTLEMEV